MPKTTNLASPCVFYDNFRKCPILEGNQPLKEDLDKIKQFFNWRNDVSGGQPF
jgi:hypothetical protein